MGEWPTGGVDMKHPDRLQQEARAMRADGLSCERVAHILTASGSAVSPASVRRWTADMGRYEDHRLYDDEQKAVAVRLWDSGVRSLRRLSALVSAELDRPIGRRTVKRWVGGNL